MYDILCLVGLICLVVSVLGAIPYLIWMGVTLYQKRWRRFWLQVFVPILFMVLLMVATTYAGRADFKNDLAGYFDTRAELGKPIFEYDSERDFHGDGYSIAVYFLPDAIRSRFVDPDARFLTEFPKKPKMRREWDTEHWRETPADARSGNYLDFALDERFVHVSAVHFSAIRAAMRRKGSCYSFFKKEFDGKVWNIDFLLVDLEKGRLYMINRNE